MTKSIDDKKNISTEDYIKAIYKLAGEEGKVTTSALASQLQLTDASVTDMIKKLSEKGLVRYARYRGVALSARGKRMAMQIVRRHRLWEMYLVRFLGFSWDQVHNEAERLEHVTSEDLERRLDEALSFPASDPHGDPIPGADGSLKSSAYSPLTEYDAGDVVKVSRVSDHDSQLLQHATRIGLGINKRLIVKEKMAFDGSMLIKVGANEHFISRQLAQSIFVFRA